MGISLPQGTDSVLKIIKPFPATDIIVGNYHLHKVTILSPVPANSCKGYFPVAGIGDEKAGNSADDNFKKIPAGLMEEIQFQGHGTERFSLL